MVENIVPLHPERVSGMYSFDDVDQSPVLRAALKSVHTRQCAFCGEEPPTAFLIRAAGVWEAPYMVNEEADRQDAWFLDGWVCLTCLKEELDG